MITRPPGHHKKRPFEGSSLTGRTGMIPFSILIAKILYLPCSHLLQIIIQIVTVSFSVISGRIPANIDHLLFLRRSASIRSAAVSPCSGPEPPAANCFCLNTVCTEYGKRQQQSCTSSQSEPSHPCPPPFPKMTHPVPISH